MNEQSMPRRHSTPTIIATAIILVFGLWVWYNNRTNNLNQQRNICEQEVFARHIDTSTSYGFGEYADALGQCNEEYSFWNFIH
jgi:hypothetical protein